MPSEGFSTENGGVYAIRACVSDIDLIHTANQVIDYAVVAELVDAQR